MVRDRAGRTVRRKLVIRSVSERGLGAHLLGEAAEHLPSGTQVVVRLPGFGALLELPGRIVWSDRIGEQPTIVRVGIVLFVDIVPAATRRLYGAWLAAIAARQPESERLEGRRRCLEVGVQEVFDQGYQPLRPLPDDADMRGARQDGQA